MNRALVFNRKAETGLVETRSELSVSIRTGGVSREEALKDLLYIPIKFDTMGSQLILYATQDF